MNKFAKRSTRSKTNGEYNGLAPHQQLTPRQACDYADECGVQINPNILSMYRRDGIGPRYLVINGRWIRYTPKLLEPFLKAKKTREVDPADKFVAA